MAALTALVVAGFVTGLKQGWDAFVAACIVALTLLGAALPFVLTGVLVGVPLWFWLRSRRHRRMRPQVDQGAVGT